MASDTERLDTDEHQRRLATLRADRRALAARLGNPRWLHRGFGTLAAAFVASPAIPDGVWRTIVLLAVLTASLSLLSAYRRTTGARLSRLGPSAATYFAAVCAVSLVMVSVSFGLTAGGLSWWITASAAITALIVERLVRRFVHAAHDHLDHGI